MLSGEKQSLQRAKNFEKSPKPEPDRAAPLDRARAEALAARGLGGRPPRLLRLQARRVPSGRPRAPGDGTEERAPSGPVPARRAPPALRFTAQRVYK